MWHTVCTVLKILELCKITYMYIVTNSMKHCFVCKVSDHINRFFDKKTISENAVGSYAIVNKVLYC